jgi:hypothetical protein
VPSLSSTNAKRLTLLALLACIPPALPQVTLPGHRVALPLGPILLQAQGKGDQIYACQDSANGPAWILARPDAVLFNAQGNKVGTHGAGPSWHHNDGSSVEGVVLEKTPAKAPDSVPWLVLRASNHQGSGLFSQVDTIERTETCGGLAPAQGCDATHLGAEVRAPYTATYTFHGKL